MSIQRAQEQVGIKDRSGHPKTSSIMEELVLLLVHGTLHLIGFDHQNDTDRQEMISVERQILQRFRALQGLSA